MPKYLYYSVSGIWGSDAKSDPEDRDYISDQRIFSSTEDSDSDPESESESKELISTKKISRMSPKDQQQRKSLNNWRLRNS